MGKGPVTSAVTNQHPWQRKEAQKGWAQRCAPEAQGREQGVSRAVVKS